MGTSGSTIPSMADDRTKRGSADRTRINLRQRYEVKYWTTELGCTPVELRLAVMIARRHSGVGVRARAGPPLAHTVRRVLAAARKG